MCDDPFQLTITFTLMKVDMCSRKCLYHASDLSFVALLTRTHKRLDSLAPSGSCSNCLRSQRIERFDTSASVDSSSSASHDSSTADQGRSSDDIWPLATDNRLLHCTGGSADSCLRSPCTFVHDSFRPLAEFQANKSLLLVSRVCSGCTPRS